MRSFNYFFPNTDLAAFNDLIEKTEATAMEELLCEGVERERAGLLRFLDIRYVGQHHEVTVAIPNDCVINEAHMAEIAKTFHEAHERLYSYCTPDTPLEIINLRVTAVGRVDKTGLDPMPLADEACESAIKNSRPIYFEEYNEWRDTPVYDRNKLRPGNKIAGPAVIEERITTIIVHPKWDARVDEFGNVIMEVKK